MMNINKLIDEISMNENDIKRIKNRITAIINFIGNDLNDIDVRYRYIGSYSLKTHVNYENDSFDIDVSLIFSSSEINILEEKKQKKIKDIIKEILEKYEDKIASLNKLEISTKVITAVFKYKDETKDYHIDFSIIKEENSNFYLSIGKIKNQYTWIKTGVFSFKNKLSEYNDDQKRMIRHIVKLLKIWTNKNIQDSYKIPSISWLQYAFLEIDKKSKILFGEVQEIEIIQLIVHSLIKDIKSYNDFSINNRKVCELIFEPRNDIFEKIIIENKLDSVLNKLNYLSSNLVSLMNSKNNPIDFKERLEKIFLNKSMSNEKIKGDKASGA